MASFGLSPEQAWEVLVAVSQNANTKLHHVAEEIVGAVTGPRSPKSSSSDWPRRSPLSRGLRRRKPHEV